MVQMSDGSPSDLSMEQIKQATGRSSDNRMTERSWEDKSRQEVHEAMSVR
jgi:hypothetical protein